MTRHVVDINLAYTITKRKISTNVEYNFYDRCTYLTLQAVVFFSGQISFMISPRNATVSSNNKQVGLRRSRGVNMFYFSGLSFRDTQGSEFFGSKFSRHPGV